MEAPSAEQVTYLQAGAKKQSESQFLRSSEPQVAESERTSTDCAGLDAKQSDTGEDSDVGFTFGDSGSKWRMTKLKAVYSIAEDTGRSIEEIATDRYGSLRAFDHAREEETELERRRTYGEGYVGKERPSGELYQERTLQQRDDGDSTRESEQRRRTPELPSTQTGSIGKDSRVADTVQLDQTALNKLRARMMKAKLKGSSEFAELEQQYAAAMAGFANRKEPDIVVLGPMESRMLAARRGRDQNTDKGGRRKDGDLEMTIEDMVREERMTKNQAGGDGRRFAERIAKDAKFDNDLEYLDENATKLAKRIEKSEISLKNTAISDLQRMNRILDRCPLCYHDDTNKPPLAPVVSLATRVYLTLPTEPEIVSPAKGTVGGACIVPLQHRVNLLECDDDEWEEIRNFMKCLKRMYHDQGRDVVFYENAAAPQRRRHAAMEMVPLPRGLAADAPAFFKEAILSQAASWSQHRPLIDTLARARSTGNGGGSGGAGGLGKLSFRRSIAKEAPYFHVWFDLDGGLGHVVEDEDHWPKGDLFARETLGGMLDAPLDVVRKQGRWATGAATNERVERFRTAWRKWDWTGVLHG